MKAHDEQMKKIADIFGIPIKTKKLKGTAFDGHYVMETVYEGDRQ